MTSHKAPPGASTSSPNEIPQTRQASSHTSTPPSAATTDTSLGDEEWLVEDAPTSLPQRGPNDRPLRRGSGVSANGLPTVLSPGSRRPSNSSSVTSSSSIPIVRETGQHGEYGTSSRSAQDRKAKKASKGRAALVKKTSQLFGRNKDKEKTSPLVESSATFAAPASNGTRIVDSQTSLAPPVSSGQAGRNASYSSSTSADSQSTQTSTGSGSRRPFANLTRPLSNTSTGSAGKLRSSPAKHARRISQDSQASWQPPRSITSGHSYSPATEQPLEGQRGFHNLSASVPTLPSGRSSLPNPSSVSTGQQSGLGGRMSNWFAHLLPTSSATSSDPSGSAAAAADPQGPGAGSPARKGPSAAASFLNAARQRAVDGVRHLLDSEAAPDKCEDSMWVLGVEHPGYRPETSPRGARGPERELGDDQRSSPTGISSGGRTGPGLLNMSAVASSLPPDSPSRDGSSPTVGQNGTSLDSPSKPKRAPKEKDKEVLRWPEAFQTDFRSRVWCSYRSQYAPILSLPANQLIPSAEAYYRAYGPPLDAGGDSSVLEGLHGGDAVGGSVKSNQSQQLRPAPSAWWGRSEGGLTSDAGWGCMLRTGQSMLANALVHLHLGREWRLPPSKPSTSPTSPTELADLRTYAAYVRLLSWFMDDPSPLCPFSVHRMALIGKELGKEVGEWFGPSTAAGALKTLANSFPPAGLAVATATDSMIYRSDVYAASALGSSGWEKDDVPGPKPERAKTGKSGKWGNKAVLILIGLRLGLDGVNPMYHETIKALFAFPQSVGIAGGRPSSSYYFVASQANSLFYLDPHLTRPAVPLEIPPTPSAPQDPPSGSTTRSSPSSTTVSSRQPQARKSSAESRTHRKHSSIANMSALEVVDVDDVSDPSDEDSTGMAGRKQKNRRSSREAKRLSAPAGTLPHLDLELGRARAETAVESTAENRATPRMPSAASDKADAGGGSPLTADHVSKPSADTLWWADAYPDSALRSYHCEKVKKMPLSGLDPSMLLGFMCRDEAEFDDFCERVARLPQKIFTVQDEPPTWDNDSEAGLESVSEPDNDLHSDDESFTSPSPVGGPVSIAPGLTRGDTVVAGLHADAEEVFEPSSFGSKTTFGGRAPAVRGGGAEVAEPETPPTFRARPQRQDTATLDSAASTPSSQPVLVERPSDDGVSDLPTPTLSSAEAKEVLGNAVPPPSAPST